MPENATQKDIKWLITCGLLALCCFLLFAILLTLHKNNQNGRYALHVDKMCPYILDTKTGQVWCRVVMWDKQAAALIDYGTPANPTFHRIGTEPLTHPTELDEQIRIAEELLDILHK